MKKAPPTGGASSRVDVSARLTRSRGDRRAPGPPRPRDVTQEDHQQDDHQQQAEDSRGPVAPTGALRIEQRNEQREQQYKQKNRSHRYSPTHAIAGLTPRQLVSSLPRKMAA